MRYRILQMIAFSLVLINLYLLFIIKNHKRENQSIITNYNYKIEEIEVLNSVLGNIECHQILTEGLNIPNQILKIIQENRQRDKMDYLFILFFSQLHCNLCVESHIKSLGQFLNQLEKDQVICFVDYKDEKSLSIFKRMYQIHVPVYNVEKIGLPLDELNMPYCFVINKYNKIESCFISLKENTKRTNVYLDIIKNKYFTSKI